ncbi:MAG: alpha/beta hydrolase [Actinobacteria bacterium]|nr:alpha/beta hydrolase [Actinomycetota bacterium]
MEDRYVDVVDGTTLHYVTGGQGEPAIVFVHGWCSNATHFEAQLTAFSKTQRVLAIDRRGHGASEAPEHGYNAQQHANDLAAVFDHEQIVSAVIVGHAGGCPSVLQFATDAPERCEALVLLDTRISPKADLRGSESDSPLAQMVSSIADDATFEKIYRGFISDRHPELADSVVADALRVPRRVAQEDLSSIAIDTVSLARSVDCPVLWLSAEAADEALLGSILRDVQFQVVSESGHFVQLEVPDQVNAAIVSFLNTGLENPVRDNQQ